MSDKEFVMSPRYAMNPSRVRCYYCGKQTGDMVIHGKLRGDKKAPETIVVNYEPCEECIAKYDLDKNVILLGAVKTRPEDKTLQYIDEGLKIYPSGTYIIAEKESASKTFGVDCSNIHYIPIDNKLLKDIVKNND